MEAPPTADGHWLTAKEAAAALGISLSTFNRLQYDHEEIKPIKKLPGDRGPRLFSRDDIERLRTRRAAA